MSKIKPEDLSREDLNELVRWAFLTEETNQNLKGYIAQLEIQLKQRNKRIVELKQLLLNQGIQVL